MAGSEGTNAFARWLEAELRRRGWYPSFEKAARQTGVGRSSLNNYILGKSYPDEANLRQLAQALGCPADELRALIPAERRIDASAEVAQAEEIIRMASDLIRAMRRAEIPVERWPATVDGLARMTDHFIREGTPPYRIEEVLDGFERLLADGRDGDR